MGLRLRPVGDPGGDRRQVDDRAAAGGDHHARLGLRAEKRAFDVGVVDPVPVLFRHLRRVHPVVHAGVVAGDIQPTPGAQDPLDQGIDFSGLRNVGGQSQRPLPRGLNRCGRVVQRRLRATTHHHVSSSLRKPNRQRLANPGPAPGNQRRPASQAESIQDTHSGPQVEDIFVAHGLGNITR